MCRNLVEVDNVVDVVAVLDVDNIVVLDVLVVVVDFAVGEKSVKYLLEELARIVPYSK